MSIYDYTDYKAYVRAWIESQPKRGRGILRRMAEEFQMSPTMLSHIFQGDKHLSIEAANDIAEFMSLGDDEFEYFLLLVLYGKAGNFRLQQRFKKKIHLEQKKANQIAKRMKADTELPETSKTIFYSSWLYSGVRNMTACPSYKDVEHIAAHLKVPRNAIQKVIEFLLQNNLCVIKDGKLDVGPQQTHIGSESPLVLKHHQNWRVHGLSKMVEQNEKNLFFTSPMSMSRETAEEIRPLILDLIEGVRKKIRPSPSETVRCLGIDWFEY